MKKYYVYCRYIGSGSVGREDLSGVYDSWELAIERVTALYNMDRKNAATKGKYWDVIKNKETAEKNGLSEEEQGYYEGLLKSN